MRVAFIFDTILLKDGDDHYGMTLTYDFFKNRYLGDNREIIVVTRECARKDYDGDSSGYRKTNGKSLRVEPVKSYKKIPDILLKRACIEKEMIEIFNSVDCAIIRLPSILGILAANICERLNKPYFIECVACALDGYLNHANPMGKIVAFPIFSATRKVIRKSSDVLYVTNSFLQKRYPTNGNAYSCSDVVLLSDSPKLPSEKNTKNGIKLYTVANVSMGYKGHRFVIKALEILKKEGIRVDYYLIGNGSPDRLLKLAKKYGVLEEVHFMGSLKHDDVIGEVRNADLYIQPSLQEGMPRALIEALYEGVPSIGSNAGGIPELLDEKHVFKKRDVRAIVDSILDVINAGTSMISVAEYNNIGNYRPSILDKKRNDIYNGFYKKVSKL